LQLRRGSPVPRASGSAIELGLIQYFLPDPASARASGSAIELGLIQYFLPDPAS